MSAILAELLVPQQRLDGIRERFTTGGTWQEVTLALAGLAAFLLFLYVVLGIQRHYRYAVVNNPRKLFRSLIVQLGLPVRQRDVLHRMAAELRLEHPTLLLLAPNVFWDHAERWLQGLRQHPRGVRLELERLAYSLFSAPHPSP